MSLDSVRQFQRTGFLIPRYTDKEIVEKLEAVAQEGGYKVDRGTYTFLYADQQASFEGDQKDAKLQELLAVGTVAARQIVWQLGGSLQISVERPWDHQSRKLTGNQDAVAISPTGQQQGKFTVIDFARAIALARKHLGAVDAKPFVDFLDEGPRQLYQSREQDLQRLERMQENFFQNLTAFTLDQQRKQQEFQRELDARHAARQQAMEEEHRQRLTQLEEREAELKRVAYRCVISDEDPAVSVWRFEFYRTVRFMGYTLKSGDTESTLLMIRDAPDAQE